MRKILTREEHDKKDIRNKRIIGVILGLIMLLSTAGYLVMDFMGSKPEAVTYNGIEFKVNSNGRWDFELQGYSFSTLYNPYNTENVSLKLSKQASDYMGKTIYYAVDDEFSGQGGALNEILGNLAQFNIKDNPACITSNCSNSQAPLKTCNDNVFVFTASTTNKTSVEQKDNCIYFYSNGESVTFIPQ
jgi:hypothetical protein